MDDNEKQRDGPGVRNAAAHAANVDGDVNNEPGDRANESKQDTTDDCTQHPSAHDDGGQDVGSSPSFSSIQQDGDTLEDEVEPWIKYRKNVVVSNTLGVSGFVFVCVTSCICGLAVTTHSMLVAPFHHHFPCGKLTEMICNLNSLFLMVTSVSLGIE